MKGTLRRLMDGKESNCSKDKNNRRGQASKTTSRFKCYLTIAFNATCTLHLAEGKVEDKNFNFLVS